MAKRMTREERIKARVEKRQKTQGQYERNLHKWLNGHTNEQLVSMRMNNPTHHRRRAINAVLRHRGVKA